MLNSKENPNSKPVDDFEGLSPFEMESLINIPFTKHSPVQLKADINPEVLSGVAFLLLVEAYLNYILENKSVKLTAIGNLPRVLLKYLYGLGYIKEEMVENGLLKLSKESDAISIWNAKHICNEEGLTTKIKGKLTVSKKGKDLLKNRVELFKIIFLAYCTRLNIGYHDRLGDDKIGNIGNSFIIGLLMKYGDEEREAEFYSDKYLKAFPELINGIKDERITAIKTKEDLFAWCVSIRVFSRFLNWFGFIEIRYQDSYYHGNVFVKKTDILDKIFEAPKFN